MSMSRVAAQHDGVHRGRPPGSTPTTPGRRRRVERVAAVLVITGIAALAAATLTPRGPVSTAEALVSIGLAAAVGTGAGVVLRSRWSLLLAPAAFAAMFEFARRGLDGPTVDAVSPFSIMGAAAFVAGRGVQSVLVLVPMVLGAAYGVEIAARRRHGPARPMGRTGWAVTGTLTVALLVLGGFVARPASTAPVVAADGSAVAGSIAELTTARIGGQELTLMIRGRSTDNPVLLHLAGGPGGTDIGAMRIDPGLEEDFVVATWDQPGTGKSYAAIDPVERLTLERMVRDTLEVTDYLRDRFGQQRIFVTGQSWGTIPSVLAVQRHPEKYHAFVGTGQMVDVAETDRIFYQETLAWAQEQDDAELLATLHQIGPPPYADLLDYTTIIGSERAMYPYPEFDGSTEMPSTIWVPENSFMDRVNAVRGLVDTYSVLYPQLQELDFGADVPRLDVPVYVVMGEHEARGRVEPAKAWFDALDAPTKEWVELPRSSHRASFERSQEYTELMRRVARQSLGQ